jgi:hypothetical protein
MVYFNDILFSIFVLMYQIGGIKNFSLSFYNINFHCLCTLVNFCFIIYLLIKNIRKKYSIANDDNNYVLIDEQINNCSEESND